MNKSIVVDFISMELASACASNEPAFDMAECTIACGVGTDFTWGCRPVERRIN